MKRLHFIATVGIALIAMLCGVAIYLVLDDVTDRLAAAERRADQNSAELDSAKTTVEALNEQLRQLGEKPVVEPSDLPDSGEVVLLPGPRGLSCIEEIGYPRCRGARGDDSTVPGPKGDDSTVPGPRGPSCVEELGLEACRGDEGKPGQPGQPGQDGKDGADGRAIKSTYCGDDSRWDITYTDGTTEDGGVCRVSPGNSDEGARR